MASEFKLPELGENIESGQVAKVLIAEGDQVTKDQPVIELETDKAVVEVPSGLEGTVEKVLVKEGDEVKVGQTVFTVSAEAHETGQKETPEE
ncbi:MAG: biotin/lipoyl-containing protein, partial [Calditrichia bacterium]